ncbi:hypothetical protein pb186bvf_012454 [Paramecium bursaria]
MDLTPLKTKILTDYVKKNKNLLDEWSEKTVQAFLEHAKKFVEETYIGSQKMIDERITEDEINVLENEFKALVQKRGLVKHQQRIGCSIARKQYMKNLIRNFFLAWRLTSKNKKYLQRMAIYCDNLAKRKLPAKVFQAWRLNARNQARAQILTQINRKTDNEIMSMQREYEALIAQLEQVLEKKLVELKVEEEQHKD